MDRTVLRDSRCHPVVPPRAQPVTRRRLPAGLVGLACAAWATVCLAGKPEDITDAEMALLPPYCADANTFKYGDASNNPSPNAPKWIGMMGPGFWHIHHYCWALINLNRAQRASMPPSVQAFTRQDAIEDMYYVIHNTTSDFVILPELYTKIGEVYLQLKRPRNAETAYSKAWELRPDYWPPYVQWATYLAQAGQRERARQVAQEGLKHAPTSQTLQKMVDDLGGSDRAAARPSSSSNASAPQRTSR